MISKIRLLLIFIIVVCLIFLTTHLSTLLKKNNSLHVINSVHVHTNNNYREEKLSINKGSELDVNKNVNPNEVEENLGHFDFMIKQSEKHRTLKPLQDVKEEQTAVEKEQTVNIENKDVKKKIVNQNSEKEIPENKVTDTDTDTKKENTKLIEEKSTLKNEEQTKVRENQEIKNNKGENKAVSKQRTLIQDRLPSCSKHGEKLVGPLFIDQSVPSSITVVEKSLSVEYGGTVEKGGWWSPATCTPRVKVAIIIPYRKRFEQLKIFLRHMHPFLQRQQLHYRIIVVEMLEDDPFNRAGLFNIGFVEALKLDNFDCFVFSDVDLLPEDDRNYYGCPTSPRHMSVGVDKFDYRLPYETIFGGVGSFTKEDFQKINGMSNLFWGWGGEDDDLYGRIRALGFSLTRPSIQIGRYTMIRVHHFQSSDADPNRMNLLRNSRERMMVDGLNTLKYTLREVEQTPLVTFVKVIMKRSDYVAS